MRTYTVVVARGLALGLMILMTLSVAAQDSSKKEKKKEADPPRTSPWMNQLRALFALWDKNKDDYLDKSELAIAFYGAGAKPYDANESKTPSLKTEDRSESKKDESARDKKPDYSGRADYVFLIQLDKDNDERISRAEYMSWARDYATQLRDQAESQKKLLQLQQQATKAKGKNKKNLESQIKKQQDQINKLEKQIRRFKQVQKSLKP
jgi:hypothetical protein